MRAASSKIPAMHRACPFRLTNTPAILASAAACAPTTKTTTIKG